MSAQSEPKCVINIKLTSPVMREELAEEAQKGLIYFLFDVANSDMRGKPVLCNLVHKSHKQYCK